MRRVPSGEWRGSSGQQVYVNYSKGIGRSKLAEKFSDIIGVSSTVRNIRTVEKVLALCGG